MGELDPGAVGRLIGGSGRETRPFELLDGEQELVRVVGSRNPGGLTSVGGDLVLTTHRLLFTPLNTVDLSKVLAFALTKAGVHEKAVELVGKAEELIGEAAPIGPGALTGITSIDPGSDGGLLKPPTVVVTGSDGSRNEVGVLAGRRASNLDSGNRTTRDAFVAEVRARIRD